MNIMLNLTFFGGQKSLISELGQLFRILDNKHIKLAKNNPKK